MQSTIKAGSSPRLKRLNRRPIAFVGGLVLAVAAAGAFAGFGNDSPTSVAPPARIALQGTAGEVTPKQLLVYLVGSAAEKRMLERDIATQPGWYGQNGPGNDIDVRIVALGPDENESLETLARLLPEASITTGAGPAIKLVDMR